MANKPEGSSPLFSVSVRQAADQGRIITIAKNEWFYIVEGRVDFFLDGTWTVLSPGDCVYSPRGSVHGFKNNTDQPIRVFINIAPSGIEYFFFAAAEEWAKGEPDMSRIMTIALKYGHHHLVD